MEITGRLAADAEVRKTKTNKEFTTFTIVVNDNYKTKSGEIRESSEFINCTYWLSSKVSDVLRKASIVTVSGRIFLNEYTGKDGNKYASLGFHVNSLKIIAVPKGQIVRHQGVITNGGHKSELEKDDLPF